MTDLIGLVRQKIKRKALGAAQESIVLMRNEKTHYLYSR